jgi:hypothetical protein
VDAHVGLAVAYSLVDREEEACAVGEKLVIASPGFKTKRWLKAHNYKDQAVKDRIAGAFRKAGLK